MNKQKTEAAIKVMQAWLDGKPIEARGKVNAAWGPIGTGGPVWNWGGFDYRVKAVLPSVDWSHVNERLNWLAVGANGKAYLFERGTCDWRESLVCRPGYEGD